MKLTLQLLGLVIAYHIVGFFHGGGYLKRLDLSSLPKVRIKHGEGYVDGGKALIGGVGFIARYRAGQTVPYVYAGQRRPWQRLYLRSDIDYQFPGAKEWVARNTAMVGAFTEKMSRAGVTVLWLPVPTKTWFERGRLGSTLPPRNEFGPYPRLAATEEKAPEVYRTMVAASPAVVDLGSIYEKYAKANPDAEMFPPWDYHWSSLGITLAAKGVVEKLELASPTVVQTGTAELNHRDRLLGTLQLPSYYLRMDPAFSWREPLYDLQVSKLRRNGGRVVIAGTSYSERLKDTPNGIGEVLGRALGRDPVYFIMHDGGLEGALRKMAAEKFALRRGDVLVVEFMMSHAGRKIEGGLPDLRLNERLLSSER